MPKVLFRTYIQATLFKDELEGQISDGYWENSRPFGHWHWLRGVEVGVGNPGVYDAYPRRKYNFNNKMLVEVVGDRMIENINAKLPNENYNLKRLRKDLKEISQVVNSAVRY